MRIVDLSQHLSNNMPLYPGMPRPSFVDRATVEIDGYAMSEYHLMNHIGTHVDAPSHHSIGPSLDDMSLERLVTEAVTLAKRYANSALATFIDIMVSIDAFVASLAGLNLVARIFYAMGRDRSLPSVFGLTHPRYKSPWVCYCWLSSGSRIASRCLGSAEHRANRQGIGFGLTRW